MAGFQDLLAPKPPANPFTQALTAYEPTWADRLSLALQSLGFPESSAEGLMGTRGIGRTDKNGGVGLADMTPAGLPFALDDIRRSGNLTSLGINTAAALPIPGAKMAGEAANEGIRKFYRGTTGGTQRIDEPFSEAKGLTFAARKRESAQMYGNNIEEITAKPEAKILDDESPEFWRLIGRRRPPNGYVGSARGGAVEVVNDAIRKAREAGYDAVSFSSDADIGTVLINEAAFIRGGAR